MLRRCSALFLLMVMTLFITLQHPVLGYCYCLDAFFTGAHVSCQADGLVAPQDVQEQGVRESSCSSCCSAQAPDPDTPVSQTSHSAKPSACPDPCDDCVETLVIDVGYYFWEASSKAPSPPFTDLDSRHSLYSVCVEFQAPQSLPSFAYGRLAMPPPVDHGSISGVPLFIHQRVLRL